MSEEAVNVMDGKRVKIESKCDVTDSNVDGVDRISQLPDCIIVNILSHLWCMNDAAMTSVLSTRWYDLWRYIPFLFLFERDSDRGIRFIQRVNSIVERHKAPSLEDLTIYGELDISSHSAIAKWLQFAFSKRVEVVFFNFLRDAKENAVVLGELLRLSPSNLLQSSNLKSLSLGFLKVSGESIKLILRDCHLLERLVISDAVFTSDIEVTSLVLKHLDISSCSGGKWVEVSAENLTCMIVGSREVLLWVENAPKLVEVNLFSSTANDLHEFCFVSQLQILTIGSFRPQVLLATDIPTMPKLMELNLSYFGHSKYLLPTTTSFIKASPLLQTINLQFWREQPKDEYEEDMEVPNVEAFEHHNLKLFKFYGFDVEANMELVSFILDNCVALRKLIIGVNKNMSPYPNLENIRAMQEAADIQKTKQLLQPKLPTHILLQVTAESM